MVSVAADKPSNEGVIQEVVGNAYDSKTRLHEKMIELGQRLSPVLAPATPSAGTVAEQVEPKNPQFVLRAQIKGLTRQLDQMTEEVVDLLNRLEL